MIGARGRGEWREPLAPLSRQGRVDTGQLILACVRVGAWRMRQLTRATGGPRGRPRAGSGAPCVAVRASSWGSFSCSRLPFIWEWPPITGPNMSRWTRWAGRTGPPGSWWPAESACCGMAGACGARGDRKWRWSPRNGTPWRADVATSSVCSTRSCAPVTTRGNCRRATSAPEANAPASLRGLPSTGRRVSSRRSA